jgi:hypothetical protein
VFTDFQINKVTFMALQQVIAEHTVIILMNKRRQVGTGTLVTVGSKKVILTAYHNVEGTPADDLQFGFKHEGNAQVVATVNELSTKAREIQPNPLYSLRFDGEVTYDEKHDIAALILDSREVPRGMATFYRAPQIKPFPIPDGKSVLIFGFPVDFSTIVGPRTKLVGATPDHLRYDSTLNYEKFLPSAYDPENEFLLRYLSIDDGLRPHGYSGAGAWCALENSENEVFWIPQAILIGVITSYLTKHRLLVVAGLRPISELLSRVVARN